MKITINVPDSRVRRIKQRLKEYGIPASYLRKHIAQAAEETDWSDTDDLLIQNYVYPNQAAAVKAFRMFITVGIQVLDMQYMENGKLVEVCWSTPELLRGESLSRHWPRKPVVCPGLNAAA